MSSARFQLGALVRDGRPQIMRAGEYPYYRDRPERWAIKLEAMQRAGITVVTCYVPWRHHLVTAGGERFCFDGVDDNRNVVRFLELVGNAGLLALVKPGPFIHGEVQLGGLPDFVSPSHQQGREASVASDGTPQTSQGLLLPAALSSDFLRDCSIWLQAVAAQVIAPHLYPAGPIVAVQLGNEGIYSDANHPATAFDYSDSAIAAFQKYLAAKYRRIEDLNRRYNASYRTFEDVEPVRSWSGDQAAAMLDQGAWLGAFLGEAFQRWSAMLGKVTTVVNLPVPARAAWHPEHAASRFDFWLCRVNSRSVPYPIQYGFSSWAGVAAEDDEAFVNLALAAMRARGPNLEENWGLGWSDERCAYAACTVYQSLLSVACGSTGYAVYPACATEGWSEAIELDQAYLAQTLPDPKVMGPPYGSLAPITVDGAPAAKYGTLRLLNMFFAREGAVLLSCMRAQQIVLGLYGLHSQLVAWSPPFDARHKSLRYPQPLAAVVQGFVRACIDHGVTFAVVDLETASSEQLVQIERLVVPGGFLMDEHLQDRLASYVESGGQLLTGWEVPLYGAGLVYSDILHERVFGHGFASKECLATLQGDSRERAMRVLHLPGSPRPLASSPENMYGYSVQRGMGSAHYLDCALDEHSLGILFAASEAPCTPVKGPDGRAAFLSEYHSADGVQRFAFLLSRSDTSGTFRWITGSHELSIALPARGCAVIRVSVADGEPRIESFFVKAVNELRQQRSNDARVAYGTDSCTIPLGTDLLAYREAGAWHFETDSSLAG